MPFANDNAGTIKQRSARTHPALAALNYSSLPAASVLSPSLARRAATNSSNKSNLGQDYSSSHLNFNTPTQTWTVVRN